MHLQKLAQLLQEPRTLAWRVRHKLEVALDRYQPVAARRFDFSCDQLPNALSLTVPGFAPTMLDEPGLVGLEADVSSRLSSISRDMAFSAAHNGDRTLGRLCFAACRSVQPESVVETGVAHGVTTAYILYALHLNGRGHLHSIDLPPLTKNAADLVGIAVPDHLRERWTLHRGATRQQLPIALAQAGLVDVFVHDSLHTYRTMTWEFNTALRHLNRPGILISDDVEGNRAFEDMVNAHKPDHSSVILESNKHACCALAVFAGAACS